MSTPTPFYSDGLPYPDIETTVLPPPEFPFANNPVPDVYTKAQRRTYDILPRLFTPRIGNRTTWTNLLTYSEQFDNAAWTKNETTVGANAAVAPDGETTMDSILESAANAEHSVSRALTFTAAASGVSIFAAGGLTRTFIRVKYTDSAAATFYAFFNIASGYVGTVGAGVTASIVALQGGRFRCVCLFTPAAGAGTLTVNISTDGATVSYAGNTANGVYLWGAQAVTAASAGPYISTTSATRTVSAPDQEVTINANAQAPDPLAYLVDEDDPMIMASRRGAIGRVFSRIPRQQTVGGSAVVAKPNVPSSFDYTDKSLNNALVTPVSVFRFAEEYVIDASAQAYSDVYPYTPCTAANVAATGGTFTFTYKTSTTAALAYDAADATIAAAINALADITGDGITVSVNSTLDVASPGGITITATVGAWLAAPSLNVASLNPVTARVYDITTATSTVYTFLLRIAITITGHGVTNTGQNIFLGSSSQTTRSFFQSSTRWSVADANTLLVIADGGTPSASVLNHAGTMQREYVPGSFIVRSNDVTSFYLPGVTPDVATAADIPIPAQGSDTYELLTAIFEDSGTVNYVVGQLAQWRGPIYQLTTTTVDTADL